MSEKKIIAVVGATGAQGGGLVRAILGDATSEFSVRALTRNPQSDNAKALADAGADVVAADMDNPASIRQAFDGAHGAFCVTAFWEHFSPEKEVAQAGAMAQAAKDAGLQHVIWSTLEDTRKFIPLDDDRMPTLMEKYKVPHFDGKGEADQAFRDLGVPTTFLLTSAYFENMIYFGMGPKKSDDGKYAVTLPMGDQKLPWIAVEDIGKCAYGIFKEGAKHIDQTVGIAGEHLTGEELAAGLSRALGVEVAYNAVEPEVYRGFGFPGADDLGNMFQFNRDFSDDFCAARNVEVARALNQELQDLDAWLASNKDRIPLD